jgi:predicted deacetylase
MSVASYILRCDDIAEHMDLEKWQAVFAVCDKYDIKPLVAVIPKLEDDQLLGYNKVSEFWEMVNLWKSKGYEIGLHGLNHKYASTKRGLITPRPKSEFSGLSLKDQSKKIEESLSIFKTNGIQPNIFIAPGHSFDNDTIKALKLNGINIISDGFFRKATYYKNINWIPQQLWKGEKKELFSFWLVILTVGRVSKSKK